MDNQPFLSTVSAEDLLHDTARLQEIVDLDLFSDGVKAILDELTLQAARLLNMPRSMVSLVLDEAQYFASHYGIDGTWVAEAKGTPVEWSFCQHAIKGRAPLIIEDSALDPRVANSPLALYEGVKCYAGIPMITSKGHAIGSFCVTGTEARSFSAQDLSILRRLAAEVIRRIEIRAGR